MELTGHKYPPWGWLLAAGTDLTLFWVTGPLQAVLSGPVITKGSSILGLPNRVEMHRMLLTWWLTTVMSNLFSVIPYNMDVAVCVAVEKEESSDVVQHLVLSIMFLISVAQKHIVTQNKTL